MHQIYASQTASVTELKRQYATILAEAEDQPVAILNNNKPEAYFMSAQAYERLMDRLEDLEDMILVLERSNEPSVEVTLEDLSRGDI